MARARNLKPSFFTNDLLAEIHPLGRLLFQGLWCIADREGRLEDRPKRIKAELLPYDDCDADALLNDLVKHGFILRYEADGHRFIQVVNFAKHQNPHIKEAASTIPAPCEHSASPVQAQEDPGLAGLIPDSLNPITDSGFPLEPAPAKPSPASRGSTLPKDWNPDDDQIEFCRRERPDLDPYAVASRFRDYWVAVPGAKGRKSDWSATWRNWVRNEKASARASPRQSESDRRMAEFLAPSIFPDDGLTIDMEDTR
ncbi:hypothetical protein NDR89_23235 [Cupriavidus gilardii]|uniref:DnaT DNA-binding domain-containing protein n=1 Tax=Cupriavidus gilardii TaxID=82541 RepID=A0ABY4VVV4_9BURK|nr:hypothetical protein [Cupriavidus gilardii]USE79508.1 hypothetical protein NDR89_23235 [Cupriavidus gilardii]